MSSATRTRPAVGGAGAPSPSEEAGFNPLAHREVLASRLSALAAQFRASTKLFGSHEKAKILEQAVVSLRALGTPHSLRTILTEIELALTEDKKGQWKPDSQKTQIVDTIFAWWAEVNPDFLEDPLPRNLAAYTRMLSFFDLAFVQIGQSLPLKVIIKLWLLEQGGRVLSLPFIIRRWLTAQKEDWDWVLSLGLPCKAEDSASVILSEACQSRSPLALQALIEHRYPLTREVLEYCIYHATSAPLSPGSDPLWDSIQSHPDFDRFVQSATAGNLLQYAKTHRKFHFVLFLLERGALLTEDFLYEMCEPAAIGFLEKRIWDLMGERPEFLQLASHILLSRALSKKNCLAIAVIWEKGGIQLNQLQLQDSITTLYCNPQTYQDRYFKIKAMIEIHPGLGLALLNLVHEYFRVNFLSPCFEPSNKNLLQLCCKNLKFLKQREHRECFAELIATCLGLDPSLRDFFSNIPEVRSRLYLSLIDNGSYPVGGDLHGAERYPHRPYLYWIVSKIRDFDSTLTKEILSQPHQASTTEMTWAFLALYRLDPGHFAQELQSEAGLAFTRIYARKLEKRLGILCEEGKLSPSEYETMKNLDLFTVKPVDLAAFDFLKEQLRSGEDFLSDRTRASLVYNAMCTLWNEPGLIGHGEVLAVLTHLLISVTSLRLSIALAVLDVLSVLSAPVFPEVFCSLPSSPEEAKSLEPCAAEPPETVPAPLNLEQFEIDLWLALWQLSGSVKDIPGETFVGDPIVILEEEKRQIASNVFLQIQALAGTEPFVDQALHRLLHYAPQP